MTARQWDTALAPGADARRSTPGVPAPAGVSPAVLPGLLVAVVLVGLGAVGIHDALVGAGWVAGPPWVDPVLDALDTGVTPSVGVLLGGLLLALVGLWFVARSLGRRPRPELSLGEGTHAWITPGDAARVATLVASDVDGVVTVRARARGRTLRLRVGAVAGTDVADHVRSDVAAALVGLDPAPRVRVRVSSVGGVR